MTKFELQQPDEVFISAGAKSFMLAVNLLDNPYREERCRTLWRKGHEHARRLFEPKQPVRTPYRQRGLQVRSKGGKWK